MGKEVGAGSAETASPGASRLEQIGALTLTWHRLRVQAVTAKEARKSLAIIARTTHAGWTCWERQEPSPCEACESATEASKSFHVASRKAAAALAALRRTIRSAEAERSDAPEGLPEGLNPSNPEATQEGAQEPKEGGGPAMSRETTHGTNCMLWHPDCAIARIDRAIDYLNGCLRVAKAGGSMVGVQEHLDRIFQGTDEAYRPAPQAQEETRGAPGPADIRAGLADTFRGVLREYDAKSLDENEAIEEIFGAIRDFRQPQPPAPASPAGREPVDVDDARRLARLRGEIDYPEADPEAGAPGTQEGGSHG